MNSIKIYKSWAWELFFIVCFFSLIVHGLFRFNESIIFSWQSMLSIFEIIIGLLGVCQSLVSLPYCWKKPWIEATPHGITLHTYYSSWIPWRPIVHKKRWDQFVKVYWEGAKIKNVIFQFKNPEKNIPTSSFLNIDKLKMIKLFDDYKAKYAKN